NSGVAATKYPAHVGYKLLEGADGVVPLACLPLPVRQVPAAAEVSETCRAGEQFHVFDDVLKQRNGPSGVAGRADPVCMAPSCRSRVRVVGTQRAHYVRDQLLQRGRCSDGITGLAQPLSRVVPGRQGLLIVGMQNAR